jgi:DNA-binding PadR family transcriptional regulator
MERGVLRYILLAALKDGPKHGYQMIKWVEERTHGLYSPSPGTIYPTLQYLEDQGLVRAESQEERRVYHLTDAGRAELEANGGMVEAVIARFNQHAPAGATGHEAGYLKAELFDLMRTVQEGVGGAVRGGDEETVRRVRQAVERCKNEVRDIIARAAGTAGSAPGPAAPGGAAPAGGEGEAPTTL